MKSKTVLSVLLGILLLGLPAAAAGQPKPILLKKADFAPPTNTRTQVSKWWGEEVEKRSGGRLKIQYFPAETLLKAADIFEGTRTGVADIGIWVQAYNPAISPISALFTLPGVSPAIRPALHAAWDLVFAGDFVYLRDEFRRLGVEPLYVWGVSDQEMIASKPLDGLAALKGLKVRVIGREWPKLISEFGGTPVAMPWPEVYEALARGTLDANVGFVTANRDSKLYEVAKHHTRIHLGAPAGPAAIMNKRVWDGLPKDLQAILRQVSKEYGDRLAEVYDREVREAMQEMAGKGVQFHEWAAQDRVKLQASMEALWQAWAKSVDAKGIPGSEALRRYLELQKKYAR